MPTLRYPALLLITNTHKAIILKVESESKYTELEDFATEESIVNPLEENNEFAFETKGHLKAVAELTVKLWKKAACEQLFIAAPAGLKPRLAKLIESKIKTTPIYIPGNFIHRSEYPVLLKKLKVAKIPLKK